MTKLCTKCKRDLILTSFAADKRNVSGLQSQCTECRRQQKKTARENIRAGIGLKIITHKKCTECKEIKIVAEFYKDSGLSDGYGVKCKKCKDATTALWRAEHRKENAAVSKLYRQENPEAYRNAVLKSMYGLTLEEYNKMYIDQKGLCKMCGKVPKKTLVVDHNHQTGEIRGLLCHGCNRAIAIFDNAQLHEGAKEYLKIK
jgi:Recombination endonuclease VII